MTSARYALFASLVAGLVGCDGATKYAAVTSLPRVASSSKVPGIFDIVYRENHDTAFTALRAFSWPGKPELLAAVAWVACAAIICTWWNKRRSLSTGGHVGFAFTVAGALGNAVDRVTRGYVVDFLHLHAGRFDWPVFNLADVFLVIGAALFVSRARGLVVRSMSDELHRKLG